MDTINPAPDVVFDEAGEKPLAQFLAEAQAAKDAELMASLKAKRGAPQPMQEPITITTDARPKMNRAERRQQVKLYAMVLAGTEKQTPVRNPTIIPRSQRRRRKSA